MESSDGLLCLTDIRSVRLSVNEIRKWIKEVCPKPEAIFPPPSSPLPLSGPESMEVTTAMEPLTALSTLTPMRTSTRMDEQSVSLRGQVGVYDGVDRPPELEALLTLCIASLGVWLALVMLALTWMRLTDLNYKPSVVSFFLICILKEKLLVLTFSSRCL
jgi:hypothetical protein